MPKPKLTKLFINRVGLDGSDGRRQRLYRETEPKGFGVLISKTAKCFPIQRFGRRKTNGRCPGLTPRPSVQPKTPISGRRMPAVEKQLQR